MAQGKCPTGKVSKGGKCVDIRKGPGPKESPTMREAMLHKGGVKQSAKIESGIKKYPELFGKYKSFKKK